MQSYGSTLLIALKSVTVAVRNGHFFFSPYVCVWEPYIKNNVTSHYRVEATKYSDQNVVSVLFLYCYMICLVLEIYSLRFLNALKRASWWIPVISVTVVAENLCHILSP